MSPRQLLIATAALAAAAGAFAAEEKDPPPPHEDMMVFHGPREMHFEWMLDRIDATEEQRKQIAAMHESFRPRLDELRQSLGKNHRAFDQLDTQDSAYLSQAASLAQQRGELVADLARTEAELRAQIGTVLTAEQRAELRDWHPPRLGAARRAP